MTGLEIFGLISTAIAIIEMLLGAIPNRFVPYKSKIFKVLGYIKGIGPMFKKLNDK